MATQLRGIPIADDVSGKERFQVLADNLVTAAAQRDAGLCLRVISSFLYWVPDCTLPMLDSYCQQYNIPVILVANTTKKWDTKYARCVDPRDCFQSCPYVLDVVCAPRVHQSRILSQVAMDADRPEWVHTAEVNQAYLPKCGIIVHGSNATAPNAARHADPVMQGAVKLTRVPIATARPSRLS